MPERESEKNFFEKNAKKDVSFCKNRHYCMRRKEKGGSGVLKQARIEEICNAYYGDVFRFCLYKTGEREAAAELTQETFLLLQQKAPALEDGAVKAWLFKAAHNLSLRLFREKRKQLQNEVDLDAAEQELDFRVERLEEDEIDEETLLQIGAEILGSLGQQDQALYRMHYKLHMKYAAIAEVLGVTESTVQVRAFRLRARVLQKIRESLGGKEDAVCRETIPMK